MSIVKMKKVRVIAMADRREELLSGLQDLGCVQIIEPVNRLSDPEWSAMFHRGPSAAADVQNKLTEVNAALTALKEYAGTKDGMFIKRQTVSGKDFWSRDTEDSAASVAGIICGRLQIINQLHSKESNLIARRAALAPWEKLDLPLETDCSAHAVYRLEVCPALTVTDQLNAELAAGDLAAELYEISADKQQKYCLLICHREQEQEAQELLRRYGFSVTAFPGLSGSAADNIAAIDKTLEEISTNKQAEAGEIANYAYARDILRIYADRLAADIERENNAERLLTDETVVFFEGWAPASSMAELERLTSRLECAWEADDPAEDEFSEVPIKLKNNRLTAPLNMVTEMYSLPAYGNVDPNPLMAPFFILFYGIMMADMGYGLLMVIAGLLITGKYHPKGTGGSLFSLMTLCGVSTIIMGAVTGGFFGDFLTQLTTLIGGRVITLPSLFSPLDDTMMILIGCMALGFVQIFTGMLISVIRKFAAHNFMDALWNEITWWAVFAGLALMILNITPIVLYVGIGLVVLGPIVTGKGMGKITGIFASIYNNVTGYFGDILSYSRLMALMLAGSVISSVFNTLGAMFGNVPMFVLISLIGNALNFALNLLGCYVHDLRLQCLEYFGKFYEDGGQPFRPLSVNTKYVDIQ